MRTERKKLLIGFIGVSVVFIAIVPLTDFIMAFFNRQNGLNKPEYSNQQMLAGIISETIRALITVYLYSATQSRGRSIAHGIKFGLLYSALIASLYITLGGFYFNLKDPFQFVVVDTVILILQGIASGVVLYYVFKEQSKTAGH